MVPPSALFVLWKTGTESRSPYCDRWQERRYAGRPVRPCLSHLSFKMSLCASRERASADTKNNPNRNGQKTQGRIRGTMRWTKTLQERFWEKVNKDGPTVNEKLGPCWLWTAKNVTRKRKGYGRIKSGEKDVLAHRLAWTFSNGNIPTGIRVLHRCDESLCVRADHLFLGTQTDNMSDASRKGRLVGRFVPVGEDAGIAKLRNEQVVQIRQEFSSSGRSWRDIESLAKKETVCPGTIFAIVTGRNWRSVGGPISKTVRFVEPYCRQGHPFSGRNLLIDKTSGKRSCRICRDAREQRARPTKSRSMSI